MSKIVASQEAAIFFNIFFNIFFPLYTMWKMLEKKKSRKYEEKKKYPFATYMLTWPVDRKHVRLAGVIM